MSRHPESSHGTNGNDLCESAEWNGYQSIIQVALESTTKPPGSLLGGFFIFLCWSWRECARDLLSSRLTTEKSVTPGQGQTSQSIMPSSLRLLKRAPGNSVVDFLGGTNGGGLWTYLKNLTLVVCRQTNTRIRVRELVLLLLQLFPRKRNTT